MAKQHLTLRLEILLVPSVDFVILHTEISVITETLLMKIMLPHLKIG